MNEFLILSPRVTAKLLRLLLISFKQFSCRGYTVNGSKHTLSFRLMYLFSCEERSIFGLFLWLWCSVIFTYYEDFFVNYGVFWTLEKTDLDSLDWSRGFELKVSSMFGKLKIFLSCSVFRNWVLGSIIKKSLGNLLAAVEEDILLARVKNPF